MSSAVTHSPVLLLGCGYTLQRVATTLSEAGRRVVVTTREPPRLAHLARRGVTVLRLDLDDETSLTRLAEATRPSTVAVHAVPVLRGVTGLEDPTPRLLAPLASRVARFVYLSSTGVYGKQSAVDEKTGPAPETELQRLRVAAEDACRRTGVPTCVLRPAAIYGPGRGVHVRLQQGRYRLPGDGSNVVSRIHVDDLAALVLAALDASIVGTYPVADALPATAAEVAGFVAGLLGIPRPPAVPLDEVHETQRFTRRVDGHAVREALRVTLRYPTYREGIPASL